MTNMNDTPVYGFTVRGNNLTDHAIDICHMLPASEQAKIARYLVTFQPTGAPLHEDLEAHLTAWGWTENNRTPRSSSWSHPTATSRPRIYVALDQTNTNYNIHNQELIEAINQGALL